MRAKRVMMLKRRGRAPTKTSEPRGEKLLHVKSLCSTIPYSVLSLGLATHLKTQNYFLSRSDRKQRSLKKLISGGRQKNF